MTAEQLRRSDQPSAAVDLCRDALIRFSGHLSMRVTLGWALLDLGRLDEAREAFETVRMHAPDNLAAIRGLAQLHTLQECLDEVCEPEPRSEAVPVRPVGPAKRDASHPPVQALSGVGLTQYT